MGNALFSLATIDESLSKPFLFHASKFIDAAITMGFDPPSILHTRGSIALDIGDPELATIFYIKALDKSALSHGNSKDVPIEDGIIEALTYNQLGNSYSAVGKHDDAIKSFTKGLEISPYTLALHTNLGNAYRGIGKNNKAREIFQLGIDKTKEIGNYPPPALLNNLGILELDERNFNAALKLFQDAYSIAMKQQKTQGIILYFFNFSIYSLNIIYIFRSKYENI